MQYWPASCEIAAWLADRNELMSGDGGSDCCRVLYVVLIAAVLTGTAVMDDSEALI